MAGAEQERIAPFRAAPETVPCYFPPKTRRTPFRRDVARLAARLPLAISMAVVLAFLAGAALAQGNAYDPLQALLQDQRALIEKSSRRTIQPAIDAIRDSGLARAPVVLGAWEARQLFQRDADGLFFLAERLGDGYRLIDIDTGESVGEAAQDAVTQLRPNGGVRGLIRSALVQFQLQDPDPATRRDAIQSIARDADETHLAPLRRSIEMETDPEIRLQKARLERLLTVSFDAEDARRIEAIREFDGDIGVDMRAVLNPLLETRLEIAEGDPPATRNVARILAPGSEALSQADAYALLVEAGKAPPLVDDAAMRSALAENIVDGAVAGMPVDRLDTRDARQSAYRKLAAAGTVPPAPDEAAVRQALAPFTFFESYREPSSAVTDAAVETLRSIETSLALNQGLDLLLDALSLASIYFLAAIGLAITFGVMGVINMAHGEFIMIGAYTGYVVQQVVPGYTTSILVALPLAFAITFLAGVAMERLVIRWLYNRPLETLLATFGISIALQQLAKNIFGTQARPLTSPAWLDGAWVINDVVSISYIRIAIFVLALVFLAIFLFVMNRTRLGLEVRAVTQNPRMASSMGINPDRINMLTFGFGSGIAGIAGVAIGLFAQVTSEIGQQYIVQSFMTVVVGGVGNIWGTLAGATLIGGLQKGIEWLNPSNTLAAQTYMILFIILFIQFRPRGIIALKGRAAEA